MNIVTLGDVAQCGENPCGLWDMFIKDSPECAAWQTCAAIQNGMPLQQVGVDAYGDTIGNYPAALPCITGYGPPAPGQTYCAGVLETAAADSVAYFANHPQETMTSGASSVGFPQWAVLGLVVVGLVLVTRR